MMYSKKLDNIVLRPGFFARIFDGTFMKHVRFLGCNDIRLLKVNVRKT